jgi:hypothetical protein
MRREYDYVKKIEVDDSKLVIKCDNNNIIVNIVDGEIDINIYNENNEHLYLNELNIDDRILLTYNKNKLVKIIVCDKYELIESSDDDFN